MVLAEEEEAAAAVVAPSGDAVRGHSVVVCSAPGKVLLCGGYLILQEEGGEEEEEEGDGRGTNFDGDNNNNEKQEEEGPHAGIVLAVDRRFYCRAELLLLLLPLAAAPDSNSDDDEDRGAVPATEEKADEEGGVVVIQVESPQYGEAYRYRYSWRPSDPSSCGLTAAPESAHRNAFVEHTIRICCDNYSSQLRDLLRMMVQSPEEDATTEPRSLSAAADPRHRSVTIRLVIQGDDEFWSHPPSTSTSDHCQDGCTAAPEADLLLDAAGPTPTQQQRPRHRFRRAPRGPDGAVRKTGLGSSACLVTSVVAAMDHLLRPDDGDPSDDDKDGGSRNGHNNETPPALSAPTGTVAGAGVADCRNAAARNQRRRLRQIANLAQICHCVAQGKVGSGFDVSAACHGSHAYRRFVVGTTSSGVVGWLATDPAASSGEAGNDAPGPSRVQRAVQDLTWTDRCVVSPIPPPQTNRKSPAVSLQVVLADTAGGGSSSPGMSRLVLRHAKCDLWNELGRINRAILEAWNQAMLLDLDDAERQFLAKCTAQEWTDLGRRASRAESNSDDAGDGVEESVRGAARVLGELSALFRRWRAAFKALGVMAGADLEPDAQSALADSTQQLPGVVAAVVPGAGGRDALACLYVDDETARQRIVGHWSSVGVPALDVRLVPFGDGVRREEPE